jgi:hypothetical protein
MRKGYHKMPDGTIMKDSDHMKKYKHGGSASHGNKKAHSRSKPAGNSGLYGRVQRKQGGGGVMGPGDPQELSSAQQNLLRQAQQYSQQTGQNPAEVQRLTGIYGDQTGASNTPAPMGGFLDFYDRQVQPRGRMPEPRLPGGGRLRPPVMGPMPDAGRMGPRRLESMGQSIRDALGMMSDKMGSGTRTRPPRPRSGMPRRGGGRRGGR